MNENLLLYLAAAGGVAISIILPLLRAVMPKPKVEGLNREAKPSFWSVIKPYLAVGAVSFIVALLIMAFIGENIDDWREALLAGYTSDATIQKLTVSSERGEGAAAGA